MFRIFKGVAPVPRTSTVPFHLVTAARSRFVFILFPLNFLPFRHWRTLSGIVSKDGEWVGHESGRVNRFTLKKFTLLIVRPSMFYISSLRSIFLSTLRFLRDFRMAATFPAALIGGK
jgi:hypothetical protein